MSFSFRVHAIFALVLCLTPLVSAQTASADTITFSGSPSGLSYTEGVWQWISNYSGNFSSGHLHNGSGSPSPGLHNHGGTNGGVCCSTPYRLRRTDGQAFTLSSIWGTSSASGPITSSACTSTSGRTHVGSGTRSFSGSCYTNVTWIEWWGDGDIDNVVVNGCTGAPTVSAGGPYSVNEGGTVGVSASSNQSVTYAWDLDSDNVYETSGQSPTFSAGSYNGPGSRSIGVQATSTSGCGTSTSSATVNINNVAPSVTLGSTTNGLEGGSISFSASGSDPGPDTLTYIWDFGDGTSGSGASTQHSYSGQGSYTATVTVTDGDGGSASASTSVTVSNGHPIISNLVGDTAGSEGQGLSWTVVATDPGNDPLTYTWTFGDGSAPVSGSLPVANYTYSNEGSYQVQVVVTDGDGGSATSLLTVTVSNAAPLVSNLTGTASGLEGGTYSYSVQAVDPGSGDVLSYSWNFGDGTAPVVTSTGQVTHIFADDGTFGVEVTVTDNASPPGSDSQTMLVVVSNVAPLLGNVSAAGGNEGATLSFSATATDPGADTLVYTWTMGDGTTHTGANISHVYADDGTYALSLIVSDGDGGTDSASANIVINNVAPTIISATMSSGDEGDSLLFAASATDPGTDPLSYSWDFGDGSTDQGDSLTHVFTDNGSYTVELTVTDGDGGSTSTSSIVTIANIAPVIDSLTGTTSTDEGTLEPFTASVTDPSSSDMASMSYIWNWGDGTPNSTVASPDHAFPDDGTYSVLLTVDDGTDTVTQTHTVVVANVAPEFTSTPLAIAEEGVLYNYLPVIVDPGDEVFTWSLAASAPAAMVMDPTTGELNWTPGYADTLIGTFAVTLAVDDGDGASDGQTWTIEVDFMDSDGDGLSDTWETDNGLDPNDSSDANDDADGDGLSNADEYAAGQDPNSFDGPEAPVPVTPLTDEEVVNSVPDLIVTNAVDPQEDELLYEFEIYADSSLLVQVSSSGWVAETAVETTWKVDVPLTENTHYWWRARAADPWVEGPWSDVQEFMVNLVNDAPGAPVAVYPLEGQVVADAVPSMQWAPAEDVDNDELSYSVTIFADDLETVMAQATGVAIAEGEVNGSWSVDVPLVEDNSYAWSVMATDEHGLEGEWSAPEGFLFTLSNGAPEGVVLISPEDGSSTPERSPTLVAAEGSDPEDEAIEYYFEVDSVATFDGADYAAATVTASGTGTVEWNLAVDGIELPQNTLAYARVWGVDEASIASAPHTISFEVRGENDPPAVPTLLTPEDGATADSVTPALEASLVEDPEGDLVFYDFVVATDMDLTDVVAGGEGLGLLAGTGPSGNDNATSWRVDTNLDGELYWSARAVDEFGAASEWALPFSLTVQGGEPDIAIPGPVLGGGGPVDCSCSSSLAGAGSSGNAAALLLLLLPLAARRRRP
jgi:PKD repeat protein